MKNLKILTLMFFVLGFASPGFTQIDIPDLKACVGYPQDEACCQKNGGSWVLSDSGSFCFLNLRSSPLTKADCMNAGGYTYWRNDSTMMCLPKGILFVSGKVSEVNDDIKSIVLMSDGDTYHISTADQMVPVQTGELIEVYYTVDIDGTMRSRSVCAVKSQE